MRPSRWVVLAGGLLVAGPPAGAQDEAPIAGLLDQCRRNIGPNPIDGQRQCREVIVQVQLATFPEEYAEQKREAFALLAESYYRTGRIEDAMAHLDSVEVMSGDGSDYLMEDVAYLRDEVARLFRPLRITIRDRRVSLLSYIEGMDLEFVYPRRLERTQIRRLEILNEASLRDEDELQFVGFDEEGQAYMEVEYFPVITFGRSFGYSLIVQGKQAPGEPPRMRRYRFSFTPEDQGPVEIFWAEGWRLVERVPGSMVKVELPAKYSFAVDTQGRTQVVPQDPTQHVYLPAQAQTQLRLDGSREHTWELVYDVALYALITLTAGSALVGAR